MFLSGSMGGSSLLSWEVSGTALPKSLFGYDVIELIGEGAGSLIYAVSHQETRQLYALKHVIRRKDKDLRFIEQLENEYNVGRRCSHENLRRVVDLQSKRTLLGKVTEAALVMELFDGQPLENRLPKDLPKLLDIFIRTGRALEAMHNAGFVHCDLKPINILVGPKQQVKVIDLGQACPVGTTKKRIQGTPDYISPEQVKLAPVTVRTDVFNFGATMYWALSGQKLPTLFTIQKAKNAFLVDQFVSRPHELNPIVPENLSNLVMECVRTNPEKRPSDMTSLINRLEIIQHVIERDAAPLPGRRR
jgi:eukaryotic-like serine/threonine-protein kinase